jgi:NTE family protein
MQKGISISNVLILFFFSACLAGCVSCPSPIKVPPTRPAAPPQIMHVTRNGLRVALILGGGGARGLAHIGVLQVLHENHIPIDLIVGTSAGAIVGALYADHADINKTTRVMMHAKFFDIVDISVIPHRDGFMTGSHLVRFIRKHVEAKDFNDLEIPLITVSTDLLKGETVDIKSGPIAPAVLASAAVPGLVEPVNIYGRHLVDGGVLDNIPTEIANQYNPKVTIAVDVDRELPKEMPKYNFSILKRSIFLMTRAFRKLENEMHQPSVLIRPKVQQTSMFDLSHKKELIQAGRRAAEANMRKIKDLLCAEHIKLDNKQSACSSKS